MAATLGTVPGPPARGPTSRMSAQPRPQGKPDLEATNVCSNLACSSHWARTCVLIANMPEVTRGAGSQSASPRQPRLPRRACLSPLRGTTDRRVSCHDSLHSWPVRAAGCMRRHRPACAAPSAGRRACAAIGNLRHRASHCRDRQLQSPGGSRPDRVDCHLQPPVRPSATRTGLPIAS